MSLFSSLFLWNLSLFMFISVCSGSHIGSCLWHISLSPSLSLYFSLSLSICFWLFSLDLNLERKFYIYTLLLFFFILHIFICLFLSVCQSLYLALSQNHRRKDWLKNFVVICTDLSLFLKSKFGASSGGAIRRCLWYIW